MKEEKDPALSVLGKLSKKLPEEAIQRTKKELTRKGYDTTGYGYQYAINRFNEVVGNKWGYNWEIIKELSGKYKNGTPYWEITVSLGIWVVEWDKECIRKCVGGHIASTYADAFKGAITNAFKKTAAFWGVGKEAYEGTIDDDNKPYPDNHENRERPQLDTEEDPCSKAVSAIKNCKTTDELNKICKKIGVSNFSLSQSGALNELVEVKLNEILRDEKE